jgi:hypothetical protein
MQQPTACRSVVGLVAAVVAVTAVVAATAPAPTTMAVAVPAAALTLGPCGRAVHANSWHQQVSSRHALALAAMGFGCCCSLAVGASLVALLSARTELGSPLATKVYSSMSSVLAC